MSEIRIWQLYDHYVFLQGMVSTARLLPQVCVERTITFRNSKFSWTGVPIIASNMDTVGTFEMAVTLAKVCRSLAGERIRLKCSWYGVFGFSSSCGVLYSPVVSVHWSRTATICNRDVESLSF